MRKRLLVLDLCFFIFGYINRMSNTDKTYTNRYNILRGQVIYNFHLQNPTKRLEGSSTPASIITTMNNSRAVGPCCSTPTSIPTILVYDTDQGSSFEWDGNTFTRNTDLPNFSYTATITSIPASRIPGPAYLISVTIPDSVTSIGAAAFISCINLTSITIPNSVTSIGDNAFNSCTGLTSITIPNLVTSIGDNTFITCTGLTSIIIGNSVTSIGAGAFRQCAVLTSITIPNLVTSIGTDAFASSGLTTVTIANGQLSGILSPSSGVAFFGRTVTTILPP